VLVQQDQPDAGVPEQQAHQWRVEGGAWVYGCVEFSFLFIFGVVFFGEEKSVGAGGDAP
jgi:hypothetical protein